MQAGARLPGWRDEQGRGMVKCRYADCDGELEPGALYCDECGRSQAAGQVATALAGAQVRVQAPPARLVPERAFVRPAPPPASLARPPSAPPSRPAGAPAREPIIPLPLALAFAVVLVVLLLGLMGALAIAIVTSPLLPLLPTPIPAP